MTYTYWHWDNEKPEVGQIPITQDTFEDNREDDDLTWLVRTDDLSIFYLSWSTERLWIQWRQKA